MLIQCAMLYFCIWNYMGFDKIDFHELNIILNYSFKNTEFRF
jgi:hypothetical protein